MKKKIYYRLLAGFLFLNMLVFTGCGNANSTTDNSSAVTDTEMQPNASEDVEGTDASDNTEITETVTLDLPEGLEPAGTDIPIDGVPIQILPAEGAPDNLIHEGFPVDDKLANFFSGDSVAFTAQYVRTGYTGEVANNKSARLIDSMSDMETVSSATADYYNDAWFETHQLLVVTLVEGSGSNRHEVKSVTTGDAPAIQIHKILPEIGTCDMAQWDILIEIPRTFPAGTSFTINFVE